MRWFKHDTSAHLDAKLQKLRIKHGLEGYGLYFYCLELIAMNVDENNLTFELEHDSEIIAFNTGLHFERVQEIISDMVRLELFENNNGQITCYKLAARLDQSMTSNPKMRKMIAKLDANKSGKDGYVYFIENIDEDGFVKEIKVGKSANPHARLKENQKKYEEFGFDLKLAGYIKSEDPEALESEVIKKLKAYEVRKDWFQANDEVIKLLRHDYGMTTSCKIRLEENRLDKNRDKTLMSEPDGSRPAENADSEDSNQKTPYQKILELYHEKLPALPRVVKLSTARKAQIKARWNNDLPNLDDWEEYFEAVSESDFLMGRSKPTPNRPKPFIADLEWLTKESNMIKIIEGKYYG